jgi:hypothetical protein
MSHIFREYIERILFNPPQPLLTYPLDLADSGGVCSVARRAHAATGVPCVCAHPPSGAPERWVVYFHGNSENLKTLSPFVRDLAAVLNATVCAMEYPGYYASDGGPTAAATEHECFAAAERFVAHIKVRGQSPP